MLKIIEAIIKVMEAFYFARMIYMLLGFLIIAGLICLGVITTGFILEWW